MDTVSGTPGMEHPQNTIVAKIVIPRTTLNKHGHVRTFFMHSQHLHSGAGTGHGVPVLLVLLDS